jgi:hypothetical protein
MKIVINDVEYLTVRDTASRLNLSTTMVYRLLNDDTSLLRSIKYDKRTYVSIHSIEAYEEDKKLQ